MVQTDLRVEPLAGKVLITTCWGWCNIVGPCAKGEEGPKVVTGVVIVGGDQATMTIGLNSTVQDDDLTACAPRVVGCNGDETTEEEPSAKEALFSLGRDTCLLSPPR